MSKSAREVVSLNGQWDLAFDPKNEGKERRWHARFPRSMKMTVPGVWEQVRPGYDGVGWYRRRFAAPGAWDGKVVRLKFGAVCYVAECWLNGRHLGGHEGGFLPFEFDVSALLRPDNELVVRVINPPINHEIDGYRIGAPLNQGDLPAGKLGWYYNAGGIWQVVELVVTDPAYVADCYVKPFPRRGKAVLDITITNRGRACSAVVTCRVASSARPGRPVASATRTVRLKKGDNHLSVPVAVKEARLWSPDDPFLYSAAVEIATDSGAVDSLTVRFGMREFTVRNGAFHLNGRKIKLKGLLQQGMYPRTLIFPETPDFARRELQLLKDNGFNFLRAHLKPVNPYYLDIADELGILVQGEPAIGWIGNTPHTERHCRSQVEGLLRRDRNHPSVVLWCLMNEAYHLREFTRAQVKRLTARLAGWARKIDSTRLLVDTSGGDGSGTGAGTRIMLPNTTRTAEILDAHGYCPLPLRDSSLRDYRTRGQAGLPLLVSEYGAPEAPPDYAAVLRTYRRAEREAGLEDYRLHKDFHDSLKAQFRAAGLAKTFGSVGGMIAEASRVRADEVRLVTAAMRTNPKLAGLCFCQLADASGELFGATDVWRRPKPILAGLATAVKTPLPVAEITPRVLCQGDALSVRVMLVNEDRLGKSCTWRVEIVGARGRRIGRAVGSGRVRAEKEIQLLLRKTVRPTLKPGRYNLRMTLLHAGRTLRRESVEFIVLPRPRLVVDAAGADDPQGVIARHLRRLGARAEAFSNGYRNKNVPILFDLREGVGNRQLIREVFGQLRKIVQLGGCAVLFEPEVMLLYEHLFPTLIRMGRAMRTIGYVKRHAIFANLPADCVAGYQYADVYPDKFDRGEDVMAAGGEVLAGGLSMHMWTRPADYAWCGGLYRVPLGRGQIVVCNMKVPGNLDNSRTAQTLLANLVNYAAGVIKPGGEGQLLSRCIDPLPDSPSDQR